MEGFGLLLFCLIIFSLPIALPIGIVKLLRLFSKDKEAYYYDYKSNIKDDNKVEDVVSVHKVVSTPRTKFIDITKCPYCDSENSWYKGECKNCGAREVTRIRKEISYI